MLLFVVLFQPKLPNTQQTCWDICFGIVIRPIFDEGPEMTSHAYHIFQLWEACIFFGDVMFATESIIVMVPPQVMTNPVIMMVLKSL